MVKVKNVAAGVYADGVLYVHPQEVVEVSEAQAEHLCAKDAAGKFERVAEKKAEKAEAKR
jgi:hypothetical protein